MAMSNLENNVKVYLRNYMQMHSFIMTNDISKIFVPCIMTNSPHPTINAHNLCKITNHPHTWAVLYVSAINQHSQGDINTKYKIIYIMLQINNGSCKYKLRDAGILLHKIHWCANIYIYMVCGYMHRNI